MSIRHNTVGLRLRVQQTAGIAVADYEVWRDRLTARSIGIECEIRWERGGRSLYFRDPDGHLVELVTPGIWPNH